MKQLLSALMKFQDEIGPIKKTEVNPYFNSKYADLASILDACKPVLAKNKLVIIQTSRVESGIPILITNLYHESGENITSEYPVRPVKEDPQAYGSALSYARRYTILSMLNIIGSNDDDDANLASRTNGNGSKQQTRTQAPPSNNDIKCPVCKQLAIMGDKYEIGKYYCKNCGKRFDEKEIK
jgi:hypothetical protein